LDAGGDRHPPVPPPPEKTTILAAGQLGGIHLARKERRWWQPEPTLHRELRRRHGTGGRSRSDSELEAAKAAQVKLPKAPSEPLTGRALLIRSLIAVLLYLSVGVLVYTTLAGMSLVDAIYFCVGESFFSFFPLDWRVSRVFLVPGVIFGGLPLRRVEQRGSMCMPCAPSVWLSYARFYSLSLSISVFSRVDASSASVPDMS